jgi:hypothetical protein
MCWRAGACLYRDEIDSLGLHAPTLPSTEYSALRVLTPPAHSSNQPELSTISTSGLRCTGKSAPWVVLQLAPAGWIWSQ